MQFTCVAGASPLICHGFVLRLRIMMNLFRQLVQWLECSYVEYAKRLQSGWKAILKWLMDGHLQPHRLWLEGIARWLTQAAVVAVSPMAKLAEQVSRSHPLVRWRSQLSAASRSRLFILLVVLSLTCAVGQRFYNAPRLDVGKAAPETIYAPAQATVEDGKATEEKRKAARKEAIAVLMLDRSVNQKVREVLQRQTQQGSDIRQLAGAFPFTKTSILSTPTQIYLRKATEDDWQAVSQEASQTPLTGKAKSNRSSQPPDNRSRVDYQRAVLELRNYRRREDPDAYLALSEAIAQARFKYLNAINALNQTKVLQPKLPYDASLLDLTDVEWRQAEAQIKRAAERMLAQGIPVGLPESILKDAIKLQVQDSTAAEALPLVTRLLMASLEPNLVQDEEQTQMLGDQAALDVPAEMVGIRQGEVIVHTGETITTADFALLDYFGLSRRGIDWSGLGGFSLLVGGVVGVYGLLERRLHKGLRRRDRILLWLLALSTPLLIALHFPSTNLPAVGLLIGSIYGSPLGLAVTGLLAILLPFGMTIHWSQLLSSTAAGLLCGHMAGRLRSREELALLGGVAGVLQGGLYLLLNVASGDAWYNLLGTAAAQAFIGLAWCVGAIGISPYLEQVFDLVTPIRLVELANPNRPLLKRLAAETPGTFQHTLFVATLAEAAARVLGCNVELVRTGTLYHDIGKMHDPQGFIENQMGGSNKHDLIDDPWKSADIIKKHVTEGLVMARKFRLPKAVRAFIPEHQGNMLIAYFYHQAQERVRQDPTLPPVNDADFRYDGPAPQSRETGIVMLADACEAALRSLKDATYDEALAMINKILRARWQDNQMATSGLTREEMSKIATIFVDVWQQFNHQRIAYPKVGK